MKNREIFCLIFIIKIFTSVHGGIIPPNSCTITNQQLIDLRDLINSFTTKSTGVYYNENRETVTYSLAHSPESCEQLIDQIQYDIKHLSDIFQDLRDQSISDQKYTELKRQYEEKIQQIKRESDELVAAANQDSKRITNDLNKQIQDLQAKLTDALQENERLRKELYETKLLLIISEIQADNPASAAARFKELNIPKIVNRIIGEAYAKKHTNTRKILNFINRLGNGEAYSVSFKVLYDAMNEQNDLLTPSAILFAYNLKKAYDGGLPEFSNFIRFVQGRIPYQLNKLFFDTRLCIQNTQYRGSLFGDFSLTDGDRRRVFVYHDRSYSEHNYWYFQYDDNSEIFYIKSEPHGEYLFIPDSDVTENKDRRQVFTRIGGGRPDKGGQWIIELFENGNFAIKNNGRNEYLYVDPDYNWDDIRRKVFTWIPGGRKDYSLFNFNGC